jgi:hypothetical protein
MARALAFASIAVVVAFCTVTLLVASARGHLVVVVAITMLYAVALWTYALLMFTHARPTQQREDSAEEIARRMGFVSYRRMEFFQYVLAPWASALTAPLLMIVGLAIALGG